MVGVAYLDFSLKDLLNLFYRGIRRDPQDFIGTGWTSLVRLSWDLAILSGLLQTAFQSIGQHSNAQVGQFSGLPLSERDNLFGQRGV